jgi:hypothetical protein
VSYIFEGPVVKSTREQYIRVAAIRAYLTCALCTPVCIPVVAGCHIADGSIDFRDSLSAHNEEF